MRYQMVRTPMFIPGAVIKYSQRELPTRASPDSAPTVNYFT